MDPYATNSTDTSNSDAFWSNIDAIAALSKLSGNTTSAIA